MTKRAKRVKGTVGNGYLYSSAGADVLRAATSVPTGIFGSTTKVRKSKKTFGSILGGKEDRRLAKSILSL